jgi:tripeptide aminopeptidase
MKNAARIAAEFDSLLPKTELPELTEGYEGFHHLLNISGQTEHAELQYIIRDHDKKLFEKKKRDFVRVAKKLNEKYGADTIVLDLKDSYYNMKEKVLPNMFIVDRAKSAMESVGVTPIIRPIRGGTDGARLSYMGLICPNLSTGGVNFHSRFEFISIDSMDKMTDVLVKICEDALTEGHAKVKK